MRQRNGLVVLVCLSALAAACGGGDSASTATTVADVGDPALLDVPAPDASTTTSMLAPAQSAPASVPAAPSGPANRTTRDDESGWRLTFTIADTLSFAPHEDITFELVFENRSGGPLHVDSGQDLRFALAVPGASAASWTTRSCTRGSGDLGRGGAVAYQPGESGRYLDSYPVERTSQAGGADADACRVGPGEYLAVGQLDWCPPENLEEVRYQEKVDHVCRDGGVVTLVSQPLTVTIG